MVNRNAPKWNPKAPVVPVDKDGNWLTFPDWRFDRWEDVDPFYASLNIDGIYSGRSAKGLTLKDDNGKEYSMFLTDLVEALKNPEVHVSLGRIAGYWTAAKRGSNYGVKFVGARLF